MPLNETDKARLHLNPVTTFEWGQLPSRFSTHIERILVLSNMKATWEVKNTSIENWLAKIATILSWVPSLPQDYPNNREWLSIVLSWDMLQAFTYNKDAVTRMLDDLIRNNPEQWFRYSLWIQEWKISGKYVVNYRIIIKWNWAA